MGQESVGDAGASSLGYYGGVFSPDGRRIAANGFTGALHMWQRPDAPSSRCELHWDSGLGLSPSLQKALCLIRRVCESASRQAWSVLVTAICAAKPLQQHLSGCSHQSLRAHACSASHSATCRWCDASHVDARPRADGTDGRGRDAGGWVPRPVRGGHSGPVVDMCWAADGACLLSVSADQTARIFTELPGELVRDRAARGATPPLFLICTVCNLLPCTCTQHAMPNVASHASP